MAMSYKSQSCICITLSSFYVKENVPLQAETAASNLDRTHFIVCRRFRERIAYIVVDKSGAQCVVGYETLPD